MSDTLPELNISPQPPKTVSPGKKSLLIVALGILALISGLASQYLHRRPPATVTPNQVFSVSPAPTTDFFLTSLPKPISRITLDDLPSDLNIHGAYVYSDGSLFYTGEGSIIQYNLSIHSRVRYSNPQLANCQGNIVIIDNFLYTPCWPAGTTKNMRLYKINISNFSLEKVYGPEDNLLSEANLNLFEDGKTIWISTFNGLGKLNTQTGKIDFYTQGLGIHTTSNQIGNILVDSDYVWVSVTASAYSPGGISLFNKSTQTFAPFNFQTFTNTNRFDLEAWKLVPGGITIIYYESPGGRFTRSYTYATGVWSSPQVSDFAAVKKMQPGSISDTINGLTVLRLSDKEPVVNIQGRAPLAISELINERRYLLTSGSLDVIDSNSAFPTIIYPLGEEITSFEPSSFDRDSVYLDIDTANNTALVVRAEFCGESCTDGKVFIIDIDQRSLLKKYPLHGSWSKVQKTSTSYLFVDANDKPAFSIDSKSWDIKYY